MRLGLCCLIALTDELRHTTAYEIGREAVEWQHSKQCTLPRNAFQKNLAQRDAILSGGLPPQGCAR